MPKGIPKLGIPLFHEVMEMQYDLFYSDPPWPQTKGNARACRPKQGKNLDYKTITLSEIDMIHREFFKQASRNHNVFMWTIDKYLHEAEIMMKDCGYKLHARIIWDKGNGIAPAFTVRFSHEYLLWFFKPGYILMPMTEIRGKYNTVISEKSTVHSRKPEAAYEMLENMFPSAKKIELFARQRRDGWDAFGNEMDMMKNAI
jgi:N6-adenosine-specific RNA methylase IME4